MQLISSNATLLPRKERGVSKAVQPLRQPQSAVRGLDSHLVRAPYCADGEAKTQTDEVALKVHTVGFLPRSLCIFSWYLKTGRGSIWKLIER